MARLIYSAITSLDGYVADADGRFHWAAPDDEVHAFVNDLLRPFGTQLYGRRMYEVMRVWETMADLPDLTPSHGTSPTSGVRATRSSTRGPSTRWRPPGPGSRVASARTRCAG